MTQAPTGVVRASAKPFGCRNCGEEWPDADETLLRDVRPLGVREADRVQGVRSADGEGRLMPRVAVHHHPCARCKVKTECGGTWEQNYGGDPDVLCDEYHYVDRSGLVQTRDFICDDCEPLEDVS